MKTVLKRRPLMCLLASMPIVAVTFMATSVQAANTVASIDVAANGIARYTKISEAIDALPKSGGVVRIHAGVYHEKLKITKPNVKLIGLGKDAAKVTIINDDNPNKLNVSARRSFSPGETYTVMVTGDDFYATNLTIENPSDYEAPNYLKNGQAIALYSKGDRAVYRAVRVIGGQDTLRVDGLKRAYFYNSYVDGTVDYIYGNGKAAFDHCLIKTKINGAMDGLTTITAQGREGPNDDSGFVFFDSQLLFEYPQMTNVYLGRPWQRYAVTYFVNTKMGAQIASPGWMEFGSDGNLPTSTYREYNSLYPTSNGGWSPLNLTLRETTSRLSNESLTAEQAADLVPDIYLAGRDGWMPTLVTYGKSTHQKLPLP